MTDNATARRFGELEARIAALQRQVDQQSTRPPTIGFPRERWLGRTVANGQTYPATGDTFYVKLISAAFSPETPGSSTVTERDRGTIVLARTWPASYVAKGVEVIVDRIKGVGTGGSWWIQSSAGEGVKYAHLYGGTAIAYPLGSGGYTLPLGSFSYELLANGVGLTGNPAFPDGTAMGTVAEAIGTRLKLTTGGLYLVTAQANIYSSTMLPDGAGQTSVEVTAYLDVKKENLTETHLRGAVVTALGMTGPSGGEQWLTVHVIGTLQVNAPEIVNFWLGGSRSGGQYTTWRVANWECLLTRLAD